MKNKGSECERLRQGYPVNWWLWLNLSSGLLKPNPILVQPHQSFKIYGSQTTCIKIAGLHFKWPSPGSYPQAQASGNSACKPIHQGARYLDEHVLTHRCHDGDGIFHHSGRWPGGNACHPQSTPHGSVFIQPGSPVLSRRMCMCPPIVVSIVSV